MPMISAETKASLQKNAELVAEQLTLSFDEESVKKLDSFIEGQHAQGNDFENLVDILGSFLGECIIKKYGGVWDMSAEGGIGIFFDKENAVYPFAKVQKQFEHGKEDSVFIFYKTISTLFRSSHEA